MDDDGAAINIKLGELERRLVKLRRLADQIPNLEKDLEALRRARTLIGCSETAIPPDASQLGRGRPVVPGSVPQLLLEILREARRPLGIKAIAEALQSKGQSVAYRTLTSYLARFAKSGEVRRRGLGIYEYPGQEDLAENHKSVKATA